MRRLSFRLLLDAPGVAALDDFHETTLEGGVLAFDFTHPRTGQPVTCRFVEPSEYKSAGSGYFSAAIQLEVLL